MFQPVHLPIRQQSCWLSPQRCLFWEDTKTVVVGGFQLGRFPASTGTSVRQSSLDRLQEQVLYFKAARVLLIGGFPLPEIDQYLQEFLDWRKRFGSLKLECVLSRSNPVAETILRSTGAQLHHGMMTEGPFSWIASRIAEDKWKAQPSGTFMISGYQDPGYKKYGMPRQHPATPVFYFTPTHGLLPAFSRPEGKDLVKPGKDELVWLCLEKELEQKN